MKKLILGLMFMSLFFAGCAEDDYSADSEAIEKYNELVGFTYEQKEKSNGSGEWVYESSLPMKFEFADDYITVDGVKYSFNKKKNIGWFEYQDITITVAGRTLMVDLYTFTGSYNEELVYELTVYDVNDCGKHDYSKGAYYYGHLTQENQGENGSGENGSGESGSESESPDSVNGTYNFTTAAAPQMNGSVTLNNGEWSYKGEKSSPAASSGTYTVSKGVVTFKWKAGGTDFSEDITITDSGSKSTWKTKNEYVSTFFSMLFGVTSLEMEFTK